MIDYINLFNDVKKCCDFRFRVEWGTYWLYNDVCVCVCIFLYSMSTILERRSARIDNIKMIPGSKIGLILREKPEETWKFHQSLIMTVTKCGELFKPFSLFLLLYVTIYRHLNFKFFVVKVYINFSGLKNSHKLFYLEI